VIHFLENINDVGIQISTTSAMDQTIFDAMSKVIQKRIPEQAQLEKWLNLMIKYDFDAAANFLIESFQQR